MRLLFFILTVSLAIWSFSCDDHKSSSQVSSNVILIDDENPYERGYAVGSLYKKDIQVHLSQWMNHMKERFDLDTARMKAIIDGQTKWLQQIELLTPELLDEVQGMADAAGVGRLSLLCFNLGEEVYSFIQSGYDKCSNFYVRRPGATFLYYNQDLPKFLHGTNTPLAIKDNKSVTFTLPGYLALSGTGSGFAVSCNSLPLLRIDPDGLPLVCALRKMLSFETISDAISYAKEIDLAVPQNILLAGRDTALCIEKSKEETAIIHPDSGHLFHTNYPVKNRDYKGDFPSAYTCDRYSVMSGIGSHVTQSILDSLYQNLPIKNQDTYLRYVMNFQTNSVEFINPYNNNSTYLEL